MAADEMCKKEIKHHRRQVPMGLKSTLRELYTFCAPTRHMIWHLHYQLLCRPRNLCTCVLFSFWSLPSHVMFNRTARLDIVWEIRYYYYKNEQSKLQWFSFSNFCSCPRASSENVIEVFPDVLLLIIFLLVHMFSRIKCCSLGCVLF